MKTYAIAIRDVVANVYTQPVFTGSLGGAVREFGDRCQGKAPGQPQGDVVAMHPEHFELWVIGEYDDATGKLFDDTETERRQLAAGANYKV